MKKRKVKQYDKNFNLIATHESVVDAAKSIKANASSLYKLLRPANNKGERATRHLIKGSFFVYADASLGELQEQKNWLQGRKNKIVKKINYHRNILNKYQKMLNDLEEVEL